MNIKKVIRKKLQSFMGDDNLIKYRTLFNRSKRKLIGYKKNNSYEAIMMGKKGQQTFFGYYDKTPFSNNDNIVLGNIALCGNVKPNKENELLVGYFEVSNPSVFNEVGKTKSWCWQQGCRLQWYPRDENTLIVYNKIIDDDYGCVIQNIMTKEILEFHETPIYDIDSKGELALTLNFSRLGRLRPGYGYVNITDNTEGTLAPKDDGVWTYNFKNMQKKLIISLDFLSKYKPTETMNNAEHYINHLLFSPNNDRFLFFHLWTKDGQRYSRLLTSDITGEDIHLLTNDGKVSHYTWKNSDEILATIHYDSVGTRYYLINDNTLQVRKVYDEYLKRDGHPSYSCEGFLLTDTYPDKYSERSLILFDKDENIKKIGNYLSPLEYTGECRCDLHPRWNRSGNTIVFDSTHSGERKMYMIKLNEL